MPGADLSLLAGGSQSVVVIMSVYLHAGGTTTHVSFYLQMG